MKKRVSWLLIVLIIVVVGVYFLFFYTKKCNDAACFNSALIKCKKTSYISDAEDGSWFYSIKGKEEETCKVNVKMLQLKRGTIEMSSLQGKDMDCYLPLGIVTSPQEDLDRCHGILKEEMQKIIITRLHNYIVGNLGDIGEELEKAI
jgi:hypothetical protein